MLHLVSQIFTNKGKSTVNNKCSILFPYFQLQLYSTKLIHQAVGCMDIHNKLRTQIMTPPPRDICHQSSKDPALCAAALEAEVSRPQPTTKSQMSQTPAVWLLHQNFETEHVPAWGNQCLKLLKLRLHPMRERVQKMPLHKKLYTSLKQRLPSQTPMHEVKTWPSGGQPSI